MTQRPDILDAQDAMRDRLAKVSNVELGELIEQYATFSAAAGNQESIYHTWLAFCEQEAINRGRHLLYEGKVERVKRRLARQEK